MTIGAASLDDLDALCAEEPFVRALAKSLLFDDTRVDDVVQQTWLEALRRGVPGGEARRSWLARVVRTRASNARRDERRQLARERAAARPESLASTTELLARQEQRRQVVAAVAALPEPYRGVVMLRYFEGLAPRAIARAQGTSTETVNTRLKRARAMLREQLDASHGGDRRAWALALVPIAAAEGLGRGVVMAKLLGLFALLSAMKPFLLVLAALVLAVLVVRVNFGSQTEQPPARSAATAATPRESAVPVPAVGTEPAPAPADRVAVAAGSATESAPAALDASQLAVLVGRLVGPDGTPAAQRLCRLLCLDPLRAHPGAFEPGEIAEGAGVTALETSTDRDGRFAFEAVPAGQSHALWLGAFGPNARFLPLSHPLAAGRRTDLGTLVLELRGAIVGRVVDAAGAPVAGALVRAIDLPGALLGLAPVDRLAQGGALFCAVPDPAGFAGRSDGARAWVDGVRSKLSSNVPQAEASSRFAVLPFPRWLDAALEALPIPSAISDGEGRFRIEGLIDGDHALLVSAAGFARATKARVPVRNAERRDAGELRLVRGETLVCRVLDADGAAVQDAELRVALRPRAGLTGVLFGEAARRTDAGGRVAFDDLPRGEYVVAYRRGAGARWNVESPVESGEELELRLPRTRELHVQVVDEHGQALDGARVWLWSGPLLGELSAAGMQEPIAVAPSPVDGVPGRIRIRGLEPDTYTLGVRAAGRASVQRLAVVPPFDAAAGASSEPTLVTVELRAGLDLEVEVVDERGAAVPAAEVWVLATADASAASSASLLFSYGGYSAWDRLGRGGRRTGSDGRVRIASLPRGPATVLVRHRALGSIGVEVPELRESLRIAMPRPGRIEGTVRRAGEIPQPDSVRLTLAPEALANGSAFPVAGQVAALRDDGSFAVDGLAPGSWRVLVEDKAKDADGAVRSLGGLVMKADPTGWDFGDAGSRRATVELTPGGVERVAVDLDPLAAQPGLPAARVRGRVELDGRPIASAPIRALAGFGFATEDHAFASTGQDGRFEREGIDARSFTLNLELPLDPVCGWSRDVQTSAGETLELEYVTKTALLELAVLDVDGRPATGGEVWFTGEAVAGGRVGTRGVRVVQGRARARLPLGEYEIWVQGAMGQARLPREALRADGRREARLSADRFLRLRFLVEPDFAIEAVQVVGLGDTQPGEIRTSFFFAAGEGNECRVGCVDAGRYRVELRSGGLRYATEPATVTVAEQGPADFVLRLGARIDD